MIQTSIKILPAILELDYFKVKDYMEKFSKVATSVQIDVCDGIFVESKTWLPKATDDINGYNLDLEFDMMVSDIDKYLEVIYNYDVKKIIIHTDNMSVEDYVSIYQKIKSKNKLVRVAICDRDMEKIKSAYGHYDYVQIMGIQRVGKQGQLFDVTVLDKIKYIKLFFLTKHKSQTEESVDDNIIANMYIQIDGAMNIETIQKCKEAGASSFVVGSYLKSAIKENKLKEAYQSLKNI